MVRSQRQYRRQVRRDAGETLPQADDHAGAFFEGVQAVFVCAADDKSIIALQVAVSQADGVDKLVATVQVAFHGMDTGLAIILRAHGQALVDELLAQLDVVNHVAVVRADQVAI